MVLLVGLGIHFGHFTYFSHSALVGRPVLVHNSIVLR
jgi:hypothetical protein